MKRPTPKLVLQAVISCFIVLVLGEVWRKSRIKLLVRETYGFGAELGRRLAEDRRFSLLQVMSSSSNVIVIDGAVANTNLICDLQQEILSMNPPARIYAELHLEGFKPNETNALMFYQWEFDPRGKQIRPVQKVSFSERMVL
jgi:hypothetical protein